MTDVRPDGVVLLRPDNFVPLTRTPWGGDRIGKRFKAVTVPESVGKSIGESWEFSCDPSFPSKLLDGGGDLLAYTAAHGDAVFSKAWQGPRTVDILVKLLDAADPLSLQVHPSDDDDALKPGESGKPESWLVLAAAPGAGIYLGFSKAVSRDALRQALLRGDEAKSLLHFEPVKPGDYFEIEPGVAHAIGPGVTLLEPQRVLAGKSGKTFRMWDWGRRYDAAGKPDPQGKPRDLHVEESLRLVDPERQVGPAYAAGLRRAPNVTEKAGVTVRSFPANPYYQTTLVNMKAGARATMAVKDGYAALLVLAGAFTVGGVKPRQLIAGQPALLPHAAFPLTFTADLSLASSAVTGEFAVVTPASSPVSFA